MKKNSEYVGVDEEFIPENEKYVDESLLGNREESKKAIKKVAKGIGIGYLCLIGFVAIFMIGIIIFGFTMFSKVSNKGMEVFTETKNQIIDSYNNKSSLIPEEDGSKVNSMQEMYNEQVNNMNDDYNKSTFNSSLEFYSGTKFGSIVENLLDKIIISNKTNEEHIITVIYKDSSTILEDEIVDIKHSLDKLTEYEVSLDYDTNGYINKITIKDI